VTLVTVQLSEAQVVRMVKRLSPEGKRAVLKALIPRLDQLEQTVDYGESRMRLLAGERDLEWDELNDDEREALVDELLHEGKRA
jgi:hypothetical protein